jgi:dienelactone hydrolase
MLVLSFVTSFADARPRNAISDDELVKRVIELTPPAFNGRSIGQPMAKLWGCLRASEILTVTDPMNGQARSFTVTVTRPDIKDKTPVVVLVPTIDGETILEPSVAVQLCRSNIASVTADVLDTKEPTELPSWGIEDRQNRQAILSVRTAIDFAERHPLFIKEKMGIVGLSVGGILTSMIAGLESERLKAVVIAVGAANLPAVLTNTTNSKMSQFREKRMKHMGITDPAVYEEFMHGSVRFDPYYFAPMARPERIMLITAGADETVPTAQQRELYQAFRRPTLVEYSGGHLRTLLSLVYVYFSSVVEFLESRFRGETTIVRPSHIDLQPTLFPVLN